MSFGAAPVCAETFTMAEDPKTFCCWGKTCKKMVIWGIVYETWFAKWFTIW
jgi:hypothetical protein